MHKTIIFTDLDGTLLDAQQYSFSEALPALKEIESRNIPLIICSSKTRAEIEACREHMHNRHPFIAENGGGIFIPSGYFSLPIGGETINGYQLITLGSNYADIRQHFVALRERLGTPVRGFADMSAAEVAALTGLQLADAELARKRDFEEPFVFDGEPDENFLRAIEKEDLSWTQGRIFHIMGQHDKGRAVDILKVLYTAELGEVTSIGLGDSLNDLPLLLSVDYPILVMHENGSFDTRISLPGLLKTQNPGPRGWNETILQLLHSVSPNDSFSL